MGINIVKVRLLAGVCLLLQVCCAAHPCSNSHQYWSTELESCVNCSKCNTPEKPIVIRPCQGHVDTECGVLSDLNIDWSWLTKKDNRKHTNFEKQHHKHPYSDLDDYSFNEEKKKHHGKKAHKHRGILEDEDYFTDDIDKHLSGERKHHIHLQESVKFNDKHHKKHHVSSESFSSEDSHENKHHEKRIGDDNMLDDIEELKHTGRKEDLERWLQVSKNRLQHRKDDLIKTLREEGNLEKKKQMDNIKLSPEMKLSDDSREQKDNVEELINDKFLVHHKHNPTRKPLSNMDLKLFEELVNQEHKRQKGTTIDLLKLMKSGEGPNGIPPNLQHFKKHHKLDNAFPDSFDYRSVVPTHRLVLGEPSTISEIMDQGFSDDSEDEHFDKASSKFKVIPWEESITLEEKEPKMSPVEFTAAEQFFWDWQAVALTSAVAACLLFFVVVILYSLCQARKWKKLMKNYQCEPSAIDLEEMIARTSLMHPMGSSNTVDPSMPNHYLENLLAAKEQIEKKSNIYTPKPQFS